MIDLVMHRLEAIKQQIVALPEDELSELRDRILERDWAIWDDQIEADSMSGKLDKLLEEARPDPGSRTPG